MITYLESITRRLNCWAYIKGAEICWSGENSSKNKAFETIGDITRLVLDKGYSKVTEFVQLEFTGGQLKLKNIRLRYKILNSYVGTSEYVHTGFGQTSLYQTQNSAELGIDLLVINES